MLKWPFRLAASLCLSIGYLLRSWWKRRKLQQLLAGLPALVLIVAVSYLGIAIADQDDKLILAKYQRAAKSSLDGKDFNAAKLYLERLLEKRPGDREVLFDLARAAEHTRDYPRLASAMRLLAPEDRPVHGPSHLWQATRLLSHNPVTPQQVRLAESHLLHALTLRESVPVAHDLLGQMYFQLGLWSQAIPHLSASPDPSRRLLLAKAYVLDGQRDKGRSAGEQARDFFKRESIEHPQDAQLRINCAEACLLLEQYPEAVRVLQDALTMNDQIPIRRALARSYVMWADSLPEGISNRRMQQFEMLAKGVQAYPDELSLYDRLLKLLEHGQDTGETVRQFLLKNIVEGRAVGLSHLILGSYAFGTGRADEAKLHMEQAFAALPNADLVANNLAWLMIHTDPPHPEQALALIDPVVERNPTMPRYLDTRGHILVKLNRYRDAVRDLELAVPSLRKNVSTHKALASAYQQLGLLDLAQLHQRAADEAGKGQN
ncbi:MAG: hypothetical protein JSS49_01730 [Planctomycetes bacterium]|nr:hypothetical protein [Planctomycetota bacterium]